ncbi:META domain-containing protein [Streptomyces sp. NBC_01304]|uniref:META domain-containing protein n=1 Tax=Streptomyces sp. NBC_01304 TaxID=2903818 RepID=UPI002E141F94|nr:META domain-containing protein [Streptomyces sp. NBC_01304]
MTLTAGVAALALGLLSACGTEKSGSGSGEDGGSAVAPKSPVTGVHWTVDSYTMGGKKTEVPGTGAHVSIDDKGRASGNLGCNSFGGQAVIKGDTVKVDKIAMTEMGCNEKITKLESALMRAFEGDLKAKVSGKDAKQLTLTTAKGDSIDLSAEPPAELTGTKWTVNALLKGEVATSLAKGTKPVHLTFGKDGTVSGNLGCNNVTTSAKIGKDGKITLGPAGTTRMMCAKGAMETERELLKLFDGTVTYELKHRSLTLTNADGVGLSANAGPQEK